MFGNLINNQQIIHLLDRKKIEISPFEEDRLRSVHYPLTPRFIKEIQPDGQERLLHEFSAKNLQTEFILAGDQYVVVEIWEKLAVAEGIVGQFVPSSNLIDQGLGLTAGRIEHPFGQKGEVIRFGLKNLRSDPLALSGDDYLAYVQFFDCRGLSTKSLTLSQRDIEILVKRVASSGGS